MSKKSHHFLTLWPWPLTYDLEKLIRSGHYHYQCVYQIWEQSIPWFLSYRVNTIAGGGRRAAGGGRLRRKTITSPDPSDTGDIIILMSFEKVFIVWFFPNGAEMLHPNIGLKMCWQFPPNNIAYCRLQQMGKTLSDHDFHNITLASPATDYKDERMNE